MARPEEDAPAAVLGAPCRLAHRLAMRGEPLPDERFGDRRGLGAGAGGGEIAQPGKAVEIVGKGRRDGERGEIELGQRQLQPAVEEMTRSEEHTSELQSLMRISYAVFCLKKKNKITR